LGLLHLGDEYTDLNFRRDVMFRRKRDVLAKQIEVQTEIWDFFDWSTILQRQEKVAGTGMAMTVVTVVGSRMVGGFGWVDGALGAAKVVGNNNLRKLIVPGVIAASKSLSVYLRFVPILLTHLHQPSPPQPTSYHKSRTLFLIASQQKSKLNLQPLITYMQTVLAFPPQSEKSCVSPPTTYASDCSAL
jgi:hypothetical protein